MGFKILISRALRSSSSLSANPFIRPIVSTPRLALYSSQSTEDVNTIPETVKEIYDKIHKGITEIRSAPPNALLWSLISKCANQDDIKLLFDILQKLRVFRMSSLRIHENFNIALCQEITKACVNAGAIDYAKKVLWTYNGYGLTPTIGSVHQLLLHAQKHKNVRLAKEVMQLMKMSDLPLQAGTADILFRLWYNAGNWTLISKHGKSFVSSGVKLRHTSFDTWMRFAAKRGDVDSLWEIEKFRSESGRQLSLGSGFSCAKGFILERKPENAAAIIQVVNQSLSDADRPGVIPELQQLVSEWPLEVLKHRKNGDKKALIAALQEDIAAMIKLLPKMGLKVSVNMDDFDKNGRSFLLS